MTFDNLELAIIMDEIEQDKKFGHYVELNDFWLMILTLFLLYIIVIFGHKF